MNINQMKTQQTASPVATINNYLIKHKSQLEAGLPRHMDADRIIRIVTTAVSLNKDLQKCDPKSIFASAVVAAALGLEPGINGQGYLIPYKNNCTFVPGWRGLVDLVSRSGRATVWTGAVFKGDFFDFEMGTSPFIKYKMGGEDDISKLTHVYAVGKVNGAELPVIEVWPVKKVYKHRDKHNKVGQAHYSFKYPEMYARKVCLLQVLKYMPMSIELSSALSVQYNSENGKTTDFINGDFITVENEEAQEIPENVNKQTGEIPL